MDNKRQIALLQQEGGHRDWTASKKLQKELEVEYRREESYWHQKSRVQWLKEGDHNTKFFHSYTRQRRRMNCIQRLVSDQGEEFRSPKKIEEIILSN